jgi:hypothetical protein
MVTTAAEPVESGDERLVMAQPEKIAARGSVARQGSRAESRIRMGKDLTKQGSTIRWKSWFVKSDALDVERVEW